MQCALISGSCCVGNITMLKEALISSLVVLILCNPCHSLSKTDPKVDGNNYVSLNNFLYIPFNAQPCLQSYMDFLIMSNVYFVRANSEILFQYKKITVILAYLQIVHHVSVG